MSTRRRARQPIAATVAYLRFPVRAEHRAGLCDGAHCPRCPSTRVQKWGGFSGRQRFRCLECRRTFSTFTGTPLYYLKRPERWRAFLWCMEGRLTVRQSGALVDIDKNTALRWRHRVLDRWRLEPHRRLRGSVAVDELWKPFGLFAAVETDGSREHWMGWVDNYDRDLLPRLGAVREIVGRPGRLSELARWTASAGLVYRRRGPSDPYIAGELGFELTRWLRPFRGVVRFRNYLEWFRRARHPVGWPDVRRRSFRRQQFPRTVSERRAREHPD